MKKTLIISLLFALCLNIGAQGKFNFKHTFYVDAVSNLNTRDSVYLYYDVDEMPKFNAEGYSSIMNYIYRNLQYPEQIGAHGGVVITSFVVDNSGVVRDIEFLDTIDEFYSAEVEKVLLKMPVFEPGKKDGKKINTKIVIYIYFAIGVKLQEETHLYLDVDQLPNPSLGDYDSLTNHINSEVNRRIKSEYREELEIISFIVNEKGEVDNVSVYYIGNNSQNSTVNEILHELPRWEPGIKDGKNVSVRMILPFNLKEGREKTKQLKN